MGKKILLADDSITIQKVIELTFSDEDFDVVTVGNGRLAVERAQEVRPDVVLCDIIMPEKDGYEVCEFIKKQPSLAHVPVLLLTGAFEPFDQERAARVGCDGFLAKPFEPQTLIARVKELLKQSAARATTASPRTPTSSTQAFPSMAGPEGGAPPTRSQPPPPPEPPVAPLRAEAPPQPVPEIPRPAPVVAELPKAQPVAPAPPAPPEPVPFIGEEQYIHETPPTFADAMEFAPLPEPTEAAAKGAEELVAIAPEESATLHSSPAPEASTMVFQSAATPSSWSPTIEVPLEERAQAAVEAAHATQDMSVFEEVFEEEPVHVPPPRPRIVEPLVPTPLEFSASDRFAEPMVEDVEPEQPQEPAPRVTPAPVVAHEVSSSPAPQRLSADAASFSELAAPEVAPVASPSGAAEVAVPADQVAQIAQRVVAQISEKVVREVAWEVIPDLAEALIKKEIERLKAELQRT